VGLMASAEVEQEREVLESIARGVPLRDILTQIARSVERQAPDMSCSLLLLDRDGKHVRHGAAPSLPAEFWQAIDGLEIGACNGSCGTAAYRRERVIVEDIATSDLWANYRHIALPLGLLACWSTPIFSPEREVLGTFAMYYREPRRPTEREIAWVDGATDLAAIAILLDRSADSLRHSEARYRQIVTERKKSEERIIAQAKLLDRARDAILVHDIDGVVSYWNHGAERLYGWSSAEAVGRNVAALIYRATTAREHAHQQLTLAGEWNGELVQWTKAGKRVIIDGSWTLLSEPDAPKSVLSINTDISARKDLELQVHRAQRMESLGTLAGGVAHDFNNILAAILANVACANFGLEADHPTREFLIEIERASERATDLVRQILTFSRHQESRRQPVDLATVAGEALKLLRSTLPQGVELRSMFAADLPHVLAEPTQVHQVVMNLGTNAVHAMAPGPGVLDVRAERVVLDGTLLAGMVELPAGRYARLVVEDSGSGMDEPTLERIFDPFFTTKEPGKGTGLGLSVVHGIMKSSGGGISVRSAPGKGTSFTLYFPALAAPVVDAVARSQPAVAAPQSSAGRPRILCIDDEAAIVQVMTRLLELRGYAVSGFTEPARALQDFEADPQRYDAVVTDVLMPGLSGFDLARRLLSVRPGLPIVVTSGHIGPDEYALLTEIGVQEFVLKPTVMDDLHATLARVLSPRPR
jgi:PAS domain S-box-containing protein